MRITAYILCIYVLVLSALPCSDSFGFATGDVEEEICVRSDASACQEGDEQHNTEGYCSPFCACVCCASILLDSSKIDSLITICFVSEKVDLCKYSSHFISSFQNKHWKPPRRVA